MSNYRDDSIDTAIVSDKTWSNTRNLITDLATFTVSAFVGLMVLTIDSAIASDSTELSGRGLMSVSSAQVTDEIFLNRTSIINLLDEIQVSDRYQFNFNYQVEETVNVTDYDISQARLNHVEVVNVADSDFSHRVVHLQILETSKATDHTFEQQSIIIEETAQATEDAFIRNYSSSMSEASGVVTDYDLSLNSADLITTDYVSAHSEAFGILNAINFDTSYASAEDTTLDNQITGQVWTAHADTMAMSRYAPFNFEGISIIDGCLYAWNDQGVHLYSLEGEQIEGRMVTGKIDFGESLMHPTAAYLEYQLSGTEKSIDISITTTQSGQPKTYTYILPGEQSDYLTNGRIIFGRGLRGRHFAFDLKINGTSSHIHTLSFEYTKTARRT